MARRVLDVGDAAVYFDRLSAAMLQAARNGLVEAAHRGHQVLVSQIIPSRTPKPVDRGVYRAGWKVEIVTPDRVAILNPEPHAVFIEFGVRAQNVKIGAAMIRALTEWVQRKGLARDAATAGGIAWAIARAMQRRGVFNAQPGGGMRILEELRRSHLPQLVRETVAREMQRAAEQGSPGGAA